LLEWLPILLLNLLELPINPACFQGGRFGASGCALAGHPILPGSLNAPGQGVTLLPVALHKRLVGPSGRLRLHAQGLKAFGCCRRCLALVRLGSQESTTGETTRFRIETHLTVRQTPPGREQEADALIAFVP
jgi:hypothetical protein